MAMTELGQNICKQATECGLSNYYDPYMGNFQFSEDDLFVNMNTILMWLEEHSDYCLICQKGYVYGDDNIDYCWFLTPQETL